jgi:hypothetical protein
VTSDTTGDIDGDRRPVRGAVDLGADQHENAGIVLGSSIGNLRIGELRAAVEAFYGSPVQHSSRRFAKTAPALEVVTYRSWGGKLWAAYDGDKVVGVGTSSGYYVGAGGFGVGATGAAVSATTHARWLVCHSAYVAASRGVTTSLVARSQTRPVLSLSMVQNRYAGPQRCA